MFSNALSIRVRGHCKKTLRVVANRHTGSMGYHNDHSGPRSAIGGNVWTEMSERWPTDSVVARQA